MIQMVSLQVYCFVFPFNILLTPDRIFMNTVATLTHPAAVKNEEASRRRILQEQDIMIEVEVLSIITKEDYKIFECFETKSLENKYQEICALRRLEELGDITCECCGFFFFFFLHFLDVALIDYTHN